MIPRKNEVEPVVALLEAGEHDTAEALAKDLIKLVAGLLSDRDTFGVAIGLRTDDLRLPHGPYYGKAEAERVAREARDRGLVAFTAPLLAASRALTDDEGSMSRTCQCGHQKEQHANKWGCCVMNRQTKEKCACQVFSP